jgi:hypothetical protein
MQNQEAIFIDRDTDAGAEAGAARGKTQQIEGERLAAKDEALSKNCALN